MKPILLSLPADVRAALLSLAASHGVSEAKMIERLVTGQLIRRGALEKRAPQAKAKPKQPHPHQAPQVIKLPPQPVEPPALAGTRFLLSN